MTPRFGLALPSFVRDPEIPIAVARAAEDAGLDGVFCYDHLFRATASGQRRPAIEGTTLLGAVAAATRTIRVGTLVARATLRPPAQLASALDTVQRVSDGRLVAAIGAGDRQSRDEMVSFGYDFGTPATRLATLEAAVVATVGRGYPVWVGGRLPSLRRLAARRADGWNVWGVDAETFGRELDDVRAAADREVVATWGGLVMVGADEAELAAKRDRLRPAPGMLSGTPAQLALALAAYADAGAEWVIAGPLDSSEPANAALLAETRAHMAP